jgi:hypothetical protein
MANDVPRCCSPIIIQPVIQTRLRIRTQHAITLILQDPLDARQQLIIKARIRQHPPDILLIIDLPRLRRNHQVQLAGSLLVLDGEALADGDNALVRADEEEAPVRRHDRDHVQDLRDEVRRGAALDQQRELRRVVGRARVAVRVEVDLDRGDLLAGARELLLYVVLDVILVVWEDVGYGPAAACQQVVRDGWDEATED